MLPADRPQFETFRRAMTDVRATLPVVHAALTPTDPLEGQHAWAAAMRRYEAFEAQGGEPVLVATLYGPTGAGKSTTFKLLTGVPVPAGDDVRPMTHACVAAVPARFDDPAKLGAVFPAFSCERLGETEALKKRDDNDRRLFYVAYPDRDGELPLILGDVPDFNSVETSNWAKADRLLERAEVVVFLVPDGSYANRDTVEQLARCCRVAAHLVYVFTKTDAPRAERMWADLIGDKVPRFTGQGGFQQSRPDGRTGAEFLKDADVYCSPRDKIGLEHVQPLRPETPAFASILRGLDAQHLILRGLLTPLGQLVPFGRELCGQRDAELERLGERLKGVEAAARQVAERVAGSEYPIGRLMEVILEEARGRQTWLGRFAFKGLGYIVYPVKQIKAGLADLVASVRGDGTKADKTVQGLEAARLDDEIERLFTEWRLAFPEEMKGDGVLTQGRIEAMRKKFRTAPMGAPKADWERGVRTAVAKWCEENPILSNSLPLIPNLLAVTGAGLIVADLATTGGVLAAHGLVGAAGAGSIVAAKIVEWAERLHLKAVVEEADRGWRVQRTEEIEAHLRLEFISTVFQDWYQRREALKKLPVERCREALDALAGLSATREGAPA